MISAAQQSRTRCASVMPFVNSGKVSIDCYRCRVYQAIGLSVGGSATPFVDVPQPALEEG